MNIILKEGSDFTYKFQVLDTESTETTLPTGETKVVVTSTPRDLTGYSILAKMASSFETRTTINFSTAIEDTNYLALFLPSSSIPKTDSRNLLREYFYGYYDVFLIKENTRESVLSGKVYIQQSII